MTDRGTGRTSAQILAAPPNAVLVSPTGDPDYCQRLAEHLGRPDIKCVSKSWLLRSGYEGTRRPVVIDHALPGTLNFPEWGRYDYAVTVLRMRGLLHA